MKTSIIHAILFLLLVCEGCKESGLSPQPVMEDHWGLWGVRRSDLSMVFSAGFRGIRPPHAHPDNYSSSSDYARIADSIGFTTLIYDSGLQYFFEGYRYFQITGSVHPDYNPTYRTLEEIKAAVRRHFDEMNSNRTGLKCHPYIDEPEAIGESDKFVSGFQLWENYPVKHPGSDAYRYDVVREFTGLVRDLRQYAEAGGRRLYIATSTPEIGHECNFVTTDCGSIPLDSMRKHPSYYYNLSASELLSSYYETVSFMSRGLNAIKGNYPGKPVSQIMNFFDVSYGCRNGCTESEIREQIRLNRGHSTWHWFFQGDFVSDSVTVNGVHSSAQWNTLRSVIRGITGQVWKIPLEQASVACSGNSGEGHVTCCPCSPIPRSSPSP